MSVLVSTETEDLRRRQERFHKMKAKAVQADKPLQNYIGAIQWELDKCLQQSRLILLWSSELDSE